MGGRGAVVVACAVVLAGFAAPADVFSKRVNDYLKLHKKVARRLPPLKTTGASATIANHQQAFAQKIRTARANARQGDIFTPEVSREFHRLLQSTMASSDADRVRESLQQDEPVQVVLRVNYPYPPGAPLQSMPPTLLFSFPGLPAELDYRIVGKSLVLRDTIANVIIDYIPDLFPGPK